MWAGAQNALAGGGSFITLPSLMLTGMDARAANITSTVALFPAQIVTGFTGRADAEKPAGPVVAGARSSSAWSAGRSARVILLATPPRFFARLVPWLVLFATALFAWGSFFRRPRDEAEARAAALGHGAHPVPHRRLRRLFRRRHRLLMMAALTMAGLAVRTAGATKNVLAGVMNASAVAIFVFSNDVHWPQALVTAVGASFGGWAGALMLRRVNEKAAEARRRRDRRRADDRAVLEGALAVKRSQPAERAEHELRAFHRLPPDHDRPHHRAGTDRDPHHLDRRPAGPARGADHGRRARRSATRSCSRRSPPRSAGCMRTPTSCSTRCAGPARPISSGSAFRHGAMRARATQG